MPNRPAHETGPSMVYAQALLDLASEQNQAQPVADDLGKVAEILSSNPSFAEFLRDPGVPRDQRTSTLAKAFHGLPQLLSNFLGVLNAKGRLGLLIPIAGAYRRLLDEKLGKVDVEVTVAQALDSATREQVRQRISQALKKEAIVHEKVDPAIIGGLVLRVEDKLIDASVSHQLKAMKEQLMHKAH